MCGCCFVAAVERRVNGGCFVTAVRHSASCDLATIQSYFSMLFAFMVFIRFSFFSSGDVLFQLRISHPSVVKRFLYMYYPERGHAYTVSAFSL